jgi:hypothetical protein
MKTIIRRSKFGDELVFEKWTREEMISVMKNTVKDCHRFGVDSNTSIYWRLNDGSFGSWDETEAPERKPPLTRIIALIYSTECSLGFFGKGTIDYNSETGYWDLNMKYL